MAKYNLSAKVTDKGGLSVYGLGRFPVTLYPDQWLALLNDAPDILTMLKASMEELKAKALAYAPERAAKAATTGRVPLGSSK